MRKVLISLAAATSALAVATPAAAQIYPAPVPYGVPFGYNQYGHQGHVRALQYRIDGIQRQIEVLRARRMISRNEANGLRNESRDIERRLRRSAYNGLSYGEIQRAERQIHRLERHVRREVRDGRWGNNWNDNNRRYYDRDRDGRDDRYENDRGYDRDD